MSKSLLENGYLASIKRGDLNRKYKKEIAEITPKDK